MWNVRQKHNRDYKQYLMKQFEPPSKKTNKHEIILKKNYNHTALKDHYKIYCAICANFHDSTLYKKKNIFKSCTYYFYFLYDSIMKVSVSCTKNSDFLSIKKRFLAKKKYFCWYASLRIVR
jgi:hypothetical protein